MASLYIDRKRTELRADAESLAIYEAGERCGAVPVRMLDRVVVLAETTLSSRVLTRVAEAGVPFLVINPRNPARSATLITAATHDARRRLAQYHLHNDSEQRLAWARRLILAKLRSQCRFLENARRKRPELNKPVSDALATIRISHGLVAEERQCELARLLGWEGSAAAAYFKAFREFFAPSLDFSERNRRPPRDDRHPV